MCVALVYSYIFFTEILISYSMEQSASWKANWLSATQQIPRILWNPKFINVFTRARQLSFPPKLLLNYIK